MSSTKPSVAIVLATYNGDKYLECQIESIRNQTYADWKLFVRDDNSTDATQSIIQKFEQKDDRIINIDSGGKRLGYCQNFSVLLQHTLDAGADIVFLCDQDDFWLPTKLEKQVRWHDGKSPMLCHTDLELVDHHLKPIRSSYIQHLGLKPHLAKTAKSLLLENNITGCATSVDRKILSKALPVPEGMDNHDMWLGVVASIVGEIRYVDEAMVKYRQHSQNVIGGNNLAQTRWSLGALKATKQKHQGKLRGRIYAFGELVRRLEGQFDVEALRTYLGLASCDVPSFKKLWLLRRQGFRNQTFKGTLLTFLQLLK
ncbi:glycosyltransferase family 2 protein [Kordiimonas lacus]|jgi:glycosyltransferase involved in cell wall biosynthesis|uniref:glycosyltransferase family 2 protein n=1 Tax=Kordiimonas lacus TaxID=637679 RepID=UPI002FD9A3C1